jgi:hypothetical protein
VEHFAKMLSDLPEQRLAPALANEHHVAFALPLGVSYSSIAGIPFVCLAAHDSDIHRWTAAPIDSPAEVAADQRRQQLPGWLAENFAVASERAAQ